MNYKKQYFNIYTNTLIREFAVKVRQLKLLLRFYLFIYSFKRIKILGMTTTVIFLRHTVFMIDKFIVITIPISIPIPISLVDSQFVRSKYIKQIKTPNVTYLVWRFSVCVIIFNRNHSS